MGGIFNNKRSFLSKEELRRFKSMVEKGSVSVYRTKACPCGADIPTNKDYCSKECFDKKEGADDTDEEDD